MMKADNILSLPQHIMRQTRQGQSIKSRLGGAQKLLDRYSTAEITLPTPPWETEARDEGEAAKKETTCSKPFSARS
jgi:hypothetical protein